MGSKKKGGEDPDRLPLRWVVILVVAGAIGVGIGLVAGLLGGVGTAIGVVGLLHKSVG